MKKENQRKVLNDLMQSAKSDMSIFQRIKVGFNMFKDHFEGKYQIPRFTFLLSIATVIYVIMPFDFDIILPVIGWIDDFAILSYTLSKLNKEIECYLAFKRDMNEIQTIGK